MLLRRSAVAGVPAPPGPEVISLWQVAKAGSKGVRSAAEHEQPVEVPSTAPARLAK
jgi:hypothetical protein